jgi:hypothetical protein
LHANIGEEFLSGIFQRGPEDIDRIVDDQETVVVMLTHIYNNRRILLVVTLHTELKDDKTTKRQNDKATKRQKENQNGKGRIEQAGLRRNPDREEPLWGHLAAFCRQAKG